MTVSFKNSPVFFTVEGSGPALVLLHGFLEDSSIFSTMAKELSKEFRTVCIDLPGHGKSGTLGYVHTMDDMAEAVRTVLDELGIEECVMVGHSMGGYVSLAFSERYPARLLALGLFHSSATADSDEKKKDRQRAIDLVMRNADAFISAAIPGLFAEASKEQLKPAIAELISRVQAFDSQGIVANIRGMMERPDRTDVLFGLEVPILIIHGQFDPVIPTEVILRQVALVNECIFVELKGAGHMGYLEAPDLCLSAIRTFAQEAQTHGRTTAHH
jgi:pimeloyl-ACP methyl ester carboxylesterase